MGSVANIVNCDETGYDDERQSFDRKITYWGQSQCCNRFGVFQQRGERPQGLCKVNAACAFLSVRM